MTLRKVMIIRHGEKPPRNGPPPFGVDLDGLHSKNQLTPRGWQRAGALVLLFAPLDGRVMRSPIERPTAVFAAGISDETSSLRPQSTVAAVVAALGPGVALTVLPAPGQEGEAARQILDSGVAVGLVCWEHSRIGDLVGALTGGQIVSPHWNDTRYDGVLVLTLGPPWTLTEVPQLLLAGDASSSVSVKTDPVAAGGDG